LLCDARPVEHAPLDHVQCRVALQLAPRDESLARVVAVLLRKRWSILELHHRRGDTYDAVQLIAAKRDGRPDHLIAALEREVGVITVQS
jgi:hypothetical protein